MGQRNAALHAVGIEVAERLARRKEPAARWIGKDALRDLMRPLVRKRLEARAKQATAKGKAKRPAAKKH